MEDSIERLESCAESSYFDMLQPDGRLRCGCGRTFDPDKEGNVVSSNPYAMPICGICFEEWEKEINQKGRTKR